MSFFDEADEPQPAPRGGGGGRRRSGRGRPPSQQQAIQRRRVIAVVGVVVVIVLLAVLVHSCDVSRRNSSLRDYTNDVGVQIQRSDATGTALFEDLSSSKLHGEPAVLANDLTRLALGAQQQLHTVRNLSVPGAMQGAQQNLVQAMRMRRDGVRMIASNIQAALGTTTNRDAINQIAVATAHFYGSDVLYKSYSAPAMAAAMNAAGIAVGGADGEPISAGQFLPALGWLDPTFIADRLGSELPSSHINTAAPGLHGHSLNSVSVDGNTLSPSATNTVAATPAPTFTLNLTNGGQFNEYNVGCKVVVAGLSDTGTSKISETTPGQTTDCAVKLPTPPTPGTYQVTATVEKVPGETHLSNNSITYTVTFQ